MQEIIVNAQTRVQEEWSFDNWNGGTHGHALFLTIPETLFLASVGGKATLQNQIRDDLNNVHNVQSEFIQEVFLEIEADDGGEWREKSGLLLTRKKVAPPDAVSRIWPTGGFRVFLSHICEGQLDSIVPLENASMPGRVVAQWDKDDCTDLGIIKVDLLGLGMMAVLQDTVELCRERGKPVDLATIPKDDTATFDAICAADTVGVFQIESRAQMATLPRMQPRCFYDVAIEVVIIRPGPIQGKLVHPYLARRTGKERPTYYDERLHLILERTLGVPLFQEQVLKIAMVMADFSGDEAEELRRAMSFHRSPERMARVEAKLRERMAERGVKPDVTDAVIQSTKGFALYGFPESHAISFAILAYGSAWLKVHRGPEFFASLLNNQPMGFYSSATLVKDARRHGINTRPVCVVRSDWACTIEAPDDRVRLGFCVVNGLNRQHAESLLQTRRDKPFASRHDFLARAGLDRDELRTLAALGALSALGGHRRDALWSAETPREEEPDLFDQVIALEDATSP